MVGRFCPSNQGAFSHAARPHAIPHMIHRISRMVGDGRYTSKAAGPTNVALGGRPAYPDPERAIGEYNRFRGIALISVCCAFLVEAMRTPRTG
jgi:hypothetical protein